MSRDQTRASYEARLDRVVDYIHRHLDDELKPETLAEVACFSSYHWHRIFVAMRGETISEAIRRLRLQRAADRLANSESSVASVADRAGYGSSDAFSRAFRDAYGQPPADYRASGSHVRFKAATAAEDAAGFCVTIETLTETPCASIAHSGSYLQIERAMQKLFTGLAAQSLLNAHSKMQAVFYDDPDLVETDALRSRVISPVPPSTILAPPLESAVLRGGLYARLRYKGPYADMKSAYRWLLGVWLPQSGREPDDAPMLESYLNSPVSATPADLVTDIHLPLRAS